MSLIPIQCPGCGWRAQVGPVILGNPVRCQQCGQAFVAAAQPARTRGHWPFWLATGLSFVFVLGLLILGGRLIFGKSATARQARADGTSQVGTGTTPTPDQTAPLTPTPEPEPELTTIDLPMVVKPSTDPALPGNWYMLDRSKGVRKLIKGDSLVPLAPLEMVLFEVSQQYQVRRQAEQLAVGILLPADMGRDQYFLGCLPTVKTGGKSVPFEIKFYQSKTRGVRVAEIVTRQVPGGVPVAISIQCLVLLPKFADVPERQARTQALLNRPGRMVDRRGQPGFPDPESPDGGPQFVKAARAATSFQTLYNVFQGTHKLVAPSSTPGDGTMDPAEALRRGRGTCESRSCVVQKAMVGVARSVLVRGFAINGHRMGINDNFGYGHALLYMEDPDTGKYFMMDPSFLIRMNGAEVLPYAGPPDGNFIVLCGPGGVSDLPNPNGLAYTGLDRYYRGFATVQSTAGAPNPPEFKQMMSLVGSSQGGKGADLYRARLAGIPADLKDLAGKLLKRAG